MNNFIRCFSNNINNKYKYLGYTCIPYEVNSIPYIIVANFLKKVDLLVKPKFVPRTVMNLLTLFATNFSIVRIRNRFFYKIVKNLTKGIMITDIKTKWDDSDIRIYGHFSIEIHALIDKVEDDIRIYYSNLKK